MNQVSRPNLSYDNSEYVFLHVGCGNTSKPQAGPGFQSDQWRELRLDIDPSVAPDILGTMTEMSALADASVDAVYSSHNIEHLYPHEVPIALKEFMRVLKHNGFAVITCPDLQSTAELIVNGKLQTPAYVNPVSGTLWPVCPIDILYGHRASIAAGKPYMAHHCGFTLDTMIATLMEAGFCSVAGGLRRAAFDMWVIACKEKLPDDALASLAASHFPKCTEPMFAMDPLVTWSSQAGVWSLVETEQTVRLKAILQKRDQQTHSS